jgi:hypothetical protein
MCQYAIAPRMIKWRDRTQQRAMDREQDGMAMGDEAAEEDSIDIQFKRVGASFTAAFLTECTAIHVAVALDSPSHPCRP